MKQMIPALTAAAALFAAPAAMADTFILVHGAFQTAASWQGVAERLTKAGHAAVAVNLAGRAGDGKTPGDVSMADHIAAVRTAIEGTTGKVTLVGHSFGGMVISAVAEAMPDRIDELVYVAAYLPENGQSMQDLAMADHHGKWQADSFVVAADYSHASVNPRDRVTLFAADADAPLGQAIADAMVDEPLQPLGTPVTLTDAAFGSVRKAYVATMADNAVSTAFQLTMIGRGHVDEVIPIPTGHAPQEVAPDALVAALIAASTPELE
jgi:pimeloyl-ACP methyl ester carboxylesterase